MKRKWMLFITLVLSALLIVACGDEGDEEEAVDAAEEDEAVEEEVEEEPEEPEEIEEEVEEEEVEEEVEEEPAEETTGEGESDFDELIAHMEEETEGTATVLYENTDAQTHEMEGITVSLDAYTLVELLDFHTNYEIPFDDQTDGAVVVTQFTVSNDTEEDVHYMTSYYMSYMGADRNLSNTNTLLPEEEMLSTLLHHSDDYLLEAGEEVTGYYAYPMGAERLEDVLDVGTVEIEITTPQRDPEDYSTMMGSDTIFTLPLDADSADSEAETAAQGFYEDRVTRENMGDKEMIEQEEDIGESEELGDATVTLDGYQFTNFIPNEEEAVRFDGDEFVLLTVKFLIDNGYDEGISHSSMSSTLHLNDGEQWTLNEGMLTLYEYGDEVAPGETGELLQTFLLDQEMYEKIWKDKSFEIEIGPIRNIDGEDISKGKEATFTLK